VPLQQSPTLHSGARYHGLHSLPEILSKPLHTTNLSLDLLSRGKVRDIYAVDDEHLLLVATDRLSAFDVVLPDPIPDKGRILTGLSQFWFERTTGIVANHLTGVDPVDVVRADERDQVRGRALVVRRLHPLPIEAVARGYLIGSGWKDYGATGSVCGIGIPAGMRLAEQLPEPLFTPATKAAAGDHDENIDFERCAAIVGRETAQRVRDVTLKIYQHAAEYAAGHGIIIADTKFEFALDRDGGLVLIDECLTPDSSRFWPAELYEVGTSPPSYDKQYVRDYLETLDWNKKAPAPHLPPEIIARTSEKYREAFHRLV